MRKLIFILLIPLVCFSDTVFWRDVKAKTPVDTNTVSIDSETILTKNASFVSTVWTNGWTFNISDPYGTLLNSFSVTGTQGGNPFSTSLGFLSATGNGCSSALGAYAEAIGTFSTALGSEAKAMSLQSIVIGSHPGGSYDHGEKTFTVDTGWDGQDGMDAVYFNNVRLSDYVKGNSEGFRSLTNSFAYVPRNSHWVWRKANSDCPTEIIDFLNRHGAPKPKWTNYDVPKWGGVSVVMDGTLIYENDVFLGPATLTEITFNFFRPGFPDDEFHALAVRTSSSDGTPSPVLADRFLPLTQTGTNYNLDCYSVDTTDSGYVLNDFNGTELARIDDRGWIVTGVPDLLYGGKPVSSLLNTCVFEQLSTTSDLREHIDDKNNPHDVTPIKIGAVSTHYTGSPLSVTAEWTDDSGYEITDDIVRLEPESLSTSIGFQTHAGWKRREGHTSFTLYNVGLGYFIDADGTNNTAIGTGAFIGPVYGSTAIGPGATINSSSSIVLAANGTDSWEEYTDHGENTFSVYTGGGIEGVYFDDVNLSEYISGHGGAGLREKDDLGVYRKAKDCWIWSNWATPDADRTAPEDFIMFANSPGSSPVYYNGTAHAWYGASQFWPNGKLKYGAANIPPGGYPEGVIATNLNFAMYAYDETGTNVLYRFGANARRLDPTDETLVSWSDKPVNEYVRVSTTDMVDFLLGGKVDTSTFTASNKTTYASGTYPVTNKTGPSVVLDNHRRNFVNLSASGKMMWKTIRGLSTDVTEDVQVRNLTWSGNLASFEIRFDPTYWENPQTGWLSRTLSPGQTVYVGDDYGSYVEIGSSGSTPESWTIEDLNFGAHVVFTPSRDILPVSIPSGTDFDALMFVSAGAAPTGMQFETNVTDRIFLQPKGGKFYAPVEAGKDYIYSFTHAHGGYYYVSRTEMEPAGE